MSFSGFLQENLLVLLTFDKDRHKIIRGTVEPQLFGGIYKEVVVRIYDYIDKFKEPPAEHIADLLEDKLSSENKREARQYKDILVSLSEMREGVNAEYVMSQLEAFVRRQSLRSIAVDLAKALQKDTEESLEEADRLIKSASNQSLKVFDPGLRMSDIDRTLSFLNETSHAFPTGIPEFDRRGFGPTRKEMLLYLADTKTGKTWAMVHLAKMALMGNLRTVHITLEMSEEKVAQRYTQAFFAIAKRKEEFEVYKFNKGKDNDRFDYEQVKVKPRMSFDDPNIEKKLRKELQKWQSRMLDNIIIKQFPTGKLTVGELEAYLDNLEATERFTPDLLIVDYPDLMKLSVGAGGQYRHGLSETYKNLRGVAVARNAALACPTQGNRDAAKAKFVSRTNVSEAYSKIADADIVMAYSQTAFEKEQGLARLSIIAGRNDEDNITVVLSQSYAIGQYSIDSIVMPKDYMKSIDESSEAARDEDYDDDDE